MKKTFALISLFALLVASGDLNAQSARQGIKMMTETKYKLKEESDKYNRVFCYKVSERYDEKGNIVEKAHYDVEGKLLTKTIIKYDERGKELEYANFDADGKTLT